MYKTFSLCRLLTEADSNVCVRNASGDTPILFACVGGHAGVVSILLKAGADPNCQNASCLTPLMGAAAQGVCVCVCCILCFSHFHDCVTFAQGIVSVSEFY